MSKIILIITIFLCLYSITFSEGSDDDTPTLEKGTATLPLEEILRLYDSANNDEETIVNDAPVNAILNSIEATGQLLHNAVDLEISFNITVLTDDKWISIPLLTKDQTLFISELPEVNNGFITIKENRVSFLSKKSGVYDFKIALLKQSKKVKDRYHAKFTFSTASKTTMTLRYDESLFTLYNNENTQKSDEVILYPVNGKLSIQWKLNNKNSEQLLRKVTQKQPIEPIITSAHATTVFTSEGKLLSSLLYNLHFEGTKNLTISLDSLYTVEKIFVNGISSPFKRNDNSIAINVEPTRGGDKKGSVEIILTKDYGNYLFSGSLNYTLPTISWNINEQFIDLYLPDVFTYDFTESSFKPIENPSQPEHTYKFPNPGNKNSFHQYLIGSKAPSMDIKYEVNLEKLYYTGRQGRY